MYFSVPPVTQALILANALVFLAEMVSGNSILTPLALWPLGP
jgi:hypothetical protein